MGVAMNLLPVAVGGYALASYYCLRNPSLLHRLARGAARRRPAQLIAHRGGAGEGYENTMLTFNQAVNIGCEMLELDVQLTKDDVVVVSHDNNLLRLTGQPVLIDQTDYRDLPAIQQSVSIDFEPGEKFSDSAVAEENRRICRLEDVIATFPKTQINIDIKQKSQRLVDQVNSIIVRHKAEDRCVWGSFLKETTEMCYRTNPEIGLFFSFMELLKLLLLFYTGLLPFVSLKETHLEIPMLSIFLSEKYSQDPNASSFGRLPHLLLRVCNTLLMRPSLFRHLEARGIPTYVWVLNKEADYEAGLHHGATGIMTDFPTRLDTYLKQEGLRRKQL